MMSLRFSAPALLIAVLAIAAFPLPAHANGEPCAAEAMVVASMSARDPSLTSPKDAAAAEHLKAGNRSYRMGEYDAAIKSYVAAGLADDAPVVLYNLGQSYRSSNAYEKAIRQYRLFLDRGQPGKQLRALVECHIKTMTDELERAASTAPPQGPAPDGPGGGDMGKPPGDGADGEVREVASTEQSQPWYADAIGWTAVGAGVLTGGIGVVLLLDASGLDDEAAREDRDDVRQELRDKADSRRLWGSIVGGVGVVSLAVGIVKLILTPDAPRAESTDEAASGPSLVIGLGQIGLAGRF